MASGAEKEEEEEKPEDGVEGTRSGREEEDSLEESKQDARSESDDKKARRFQSAAMGKGDLREMERRSEDIGLNIAFYIVAAMKALLIMVLITLCCGTLVLYLEDEDVGLTVGLHILDRLGGLTMVL
ncbi:hypothetical protein NDU88_005950 [Pleurodeles waltl]|uniref:Uncharacterized protein n=1 Tax=Pleurodeles waltl TaxID=8319 RepID=A0AAV7NTQ9_PLEWA|nr:hypothetical protein NDU88_005950 [Pleurodeles waltl]